MMAILRSYHSAAHLDHSPLPRDPQRQELQSTVGRVAAAAISLLLLFLSLPLLLCLVLRRQARHLHVYISFHFVAHRIPIIAASSAATGELLLCTHTGELRNGYWRATEEALEGYWGGTGEVL